MTDRGSPPVEDPWLTVAEIADELRLTSAAVRTWISDGTLQATRAGKRKWLVRRSELDRMLHGEDYADAEPLPPPSPDDPTPRRQLRRPADGVTGRSWPDGEHELDPEDWLAVAEHEWRAAISMSRDTPPDRWFAGRLQFIARTAARKASALERFADEEDIWWENEPLADEPFLSHELSPRAFRPGPPELWARFDREVGQLAKATDSGRASMIRSRLADVAVTLHDIAESLEAYLGEHGQWLDRAAEAADNYDADPLSEDPPATDRSVS